MTASIISECSSYDFSVADGWSPVPCVKSEAVVASPFIFCASVRGTWTKGEMVNYGDGGQEARKAIPTSCGFTVAVIGLSEAGSNTTVL
jgi:hypothetical protein